MTKLAAKTIEKMSILDHQTKLLYKELDLIDSAIRQIDEITKGIKNWAIVTWTASLGAALASDELKQFIFLTALIPMLFWIVDGSYRRVQRQFIARNRAIRDFVNSDEFKNCIQESIPFDFPLLEMRIKPKHWSYSLLGVLIFRTIGLLYIGLIVISILVWIIVMKGS